MLIINILIKKDQRDDVGASRGIKSPSSFLFLLGECLVPVHSDLVLLLILSLLFRISGLSGEIKSVVVVENVMWKCFDVFEVKVLEDVLIDPMSLGYVGHLF